MRTPARTLLRLARAAALLVPGAILLGSAGTTLAYPERPIRIVAPFPPGSVVDVLARPVAPKLADAWGQSVVIDNRSGMGGSIGAEIAAKASPDGYTLLMGTNGTNAINMSLYPKMPYDTRKDFAPITRVATSYLLLTSTPRCRSIRSRI
jgi:tripartite-type tricarboxylate transporter receptor subunit TctC